MKDPAFEDIIRNGKTGLLADTNQADFADKVSRLIEDESLRGRLGRSGKKFVKKHFSSQFQAECVLNAYQKAIVINSRKKKVRRVIRTRIDIITDFLRVNAAFAKFKEAMKLLDYGPN